jgi:hypothetical protein
MSGDTKSAERADLHEFLTELNHSEYTSSIIDTFGDVGNEMIDAGMTNVADKLRRLKSAVANEYGD